MAVAGRCKAGGLRSGAGRICCQGESHWWPWRAVPAGSTVGSASGEPPEGLFVELGVGEVIIRVTANISPSPGCRAPETTMRESSSLTFVPIQPGSDRLLLDDAEAPAGGKVVIIPLSLWI